MTTASFNSYFIFAQSSLVWYNHFFDFKIRPLMRMHHGVLPNFPILALLILVLTDSNLHGVFFCFSILTSISLLLRSIQTQISCSSPCATYWRALRLVYRWSKSGRGEFIWIHAVPKNLAKSKPIHKAQSSIISGILCRCE